MKATNTARRFRPVPQSDPAPREQYRTALAGFIVCAISGLLVGFGSGLLVGFLAWHR